MMEMHLPLKIAGAWSIVDKMMRRKRPHISLMPAILRPGGGQYFCVSLMRAERWETLLMMNLNGSSIVVHPWSHSGTPLDEAPWFKDGGGYPAGFASVGVNDMVNQIEAALGFPKWEGSSSPTTRDTIGFRVIAGAAQREAFGSKVLHIENGYLDTSGGDSGVQSWVRDHADVSKTLAALSEEDWKAQARAASRLWRITVGQDDKHAVVVDVTDGRARGFKGDVDLLQLYQDSKHHLSPLVDRVMDWLS